MSLFKSKKKIINQEIIEEKNTEIINDVYQDNNNNNKNNINAFDPIQDAESLMHEIIDEFVKSKNKLISGAKQHLIQKEDFMNEVHNHMQKYYSKYSVFFNDALTLIENYIFGYYRLTPLIDDLDISDIKVVSYDNVRIKIKGKRYSSDIKFKDEKEFENFVIYIATKNQVNISNINAIQMFDDNESHPDFILRFVIGMPLITDNKKPFIAIRKVKRDFPEVNDLVKENMMSNKLKNYLVSRFIEGSTLICGPSASGKTTLLNALKEEIPDESSCLVVQQTGELTTKRHPDMIFTHSFVSKGDSKVNYSLNDVLIAGLLMDIERFIVGEIKGEEALSLLTASYTGHICSSSIHAESAYTALDKLVDYAKYHSNYTKQELLKMMSSFKTIIFVKNYKVVEVTEIHGWDYERNEPNYVSIDLNQFSY